MPPHPKKGDYADQPLWSADASAQPWFESNQNPLSGNIYYIYERFYIFCLINWENILE